MEFRVFEMQYKDEQVPDSGIQCIPFEERYFEEYRQIYNACFYEMRKALDRKPYNYLESMKQLDGKTDEIMLLMKGDEIVGSVASYGNEVDDLVVNQKFQRKGFGKKLLLYGMKKIRNRSEEPILLHVTEWNQHAVRMYQQTGFERTDMIVIKTDEIIDEDNCKEVISQEE